MNPIFFSIIKGCGNSIFQMNLKETLFLRKRNFLLFLLYVKTQINYDF